MRKLMLLLTLALVASMFLSVFPSTVLADNPQSVTTTWGKIKALYHGEAPNAMSGDTVSVTGKNRSGVGPMAMTPWAYHMFIPWMPQVLPGDWTNTMNCGQACCAMLGAWFNYGSTASWVIVDENRWLRYPSAWWNNGDPSGMSVTDIQKLLLGYHNLHSSVYIGHGADDVVAEGARWRPVIVGVRTGMTTYGKPHWMLFTGWDTQYMYFNDPGRSNITYGQIHCTPAQFEASWNSTSTPRMYIPVYR